MLPSSLKFLWLRLSYTAQTFYFCFTKFCLERVTPGQFYKMKNKSLKRIENKKKKMAALVEISQLNEYDRNMKKSRANEDLQLEPTIKKPRTDSKEVEQLELGPSGKPKLTGLELQELKKMLKEKTQRVRQNPLFKLRDLGDLASLKTDLENRVPLFLSDIQHLILYSQIGHHSPYSPARWCSLEKFNRLANTCVLIIENLSLYHYLNNENIFQYLSNFDNKLELLAPNTRNSDIVTDLSMVPLTGTQVRRFCNEFGTLEEAVLKSSEVFDAVRNLFPIENTSESIYKNLPENDRFPRTQLLLSGWQMVEENYPLPIRGLMETKYKGYILTKDKYKDVTPFSKMFGIDCEMCKTTTGDLELTRVSIVDEQFNTCLDTLVKPKNRITDYLTRFSGITHKMMKSVTTTLEDVQNTIKRMLPDDAILVGQSLGNDFHALKMMHPYVIDTSVIYNITGDRMRKTKLKTLMEEFLSEKIQEGSSGHCSTEDSTSSLKLVKLKLSKNLYFGDAVMGALENDYRHCPDLGTFNYATSLLKQITKVDRTAQVFGVNEITTKYKSCVDKGIESDFSKRISFFSEKSCKDVFSKFYDSLTNCTLSIAHIRVQNNQLEGNKMFKNVDRWVKDGFEKMAKPGLFLVIFAGSEGSNGCCFIQLKKDL